MHFGLRRKGTLLRGRACRLAPILALLSSTLANREHLKILAKGVAEWNRWRREKPTVWPDLLDARLQRANLDEVNLENANLLGADFEGASLVRANLRNANLKNARLIGANLSEANLRETNLNRADLREANLTRVDLCYSNLTGARFDETQLDFATFGYTSIDKTILTGVLGLDRVVHREPSSIDVETLEETARIIETRPHLRPMIENFFRNARVPDHWIEYSLSRIARTREWYSCLVSYSHHDEEFASLLWQRLKAKGISCWKDDEGLRLGADLLAELSSAIVRHDRVLLCCSESSLSSAWVEQEIHLALEKEKRTKQNVLLPLDIDGFLQEGWRHRLVPFLSDRLVADFVGWRVDLQKFERGFEKVARALQPGIG